MLFVHRRGVQPEAVIPLGVKDVEPKPRMFPPSFYHSVKAICTSQSNMYDKNTLRLDRALKSTKKTK